MPIVSVQGAVLSDVLLYELNNSLSRRTVILKTGNKAVYGTVLGKITEENKYVPLDPTATDGSQTACAVSIDNEDASSADGKVIVLTNTAAVFGKNLQWPEGITSEQQAQALADLEKTFIQARN
ncbi:head decoration protein [Piscirickettsia litoralis]|uniref:Head decoration protein n=1 Tax=Piscirickettsia litoralis TaxID=1891921 RepID=A0ABX2ZX22_9GAMM|nr:head decoration protein [Piscirickettsia litoralis]ODN41172.1 hypothetical protein BGC07_18025 [Piscirickettsia litoralis]